MNTDSMPRRFVAGFEEKRSAIDHRSFQRAAYKEGPVKAPGHQLVPELFAKNAALMI